jgi:carboxymethylenebutenolidase
MKNLKRIIFILGIFFFGIGAAGILCAQSAMDPGERNVSYSDPEGITLRGYLAKPSGNGPFPAVLMIHEWWGLNKDTTLLAEALADEGFVVLAADAFRGSVASTPGNARKQVTETPREQIAADLDAALDFLRSHPRVAPGRVASLGFCFGGTQSMYMGTRNPELAAVVIFYGGGPIQRAADLGSMRQAGPVLGIYGEEDGNIPVSQVRNFEDALESRKVEHTVTLYPGVGHAFVKSNTYNSGGAPEEAWNQMVMFLKENL